MAKTNKKQVGFYADDDVKDYIGSLDQGTKSRVINLALRQYMQSSAGSWKNAVLSSESLEKRIEKIEQHLRMEGK